jgi:hypothetical protein
MKTKLSLFAMTITIILSACKGDDGDIGPQGPAGANGTNGTNGAANITNTTFTATTVAWYGSPQFYFIDVPVPALTDATKDLVQVYVQKANTPEWWGLPKNWIIWAGDMTRFSFVNGTVTLWYNYSQVPTSDLNYRIVVIPAALARPDIDYINYSRVKAEYGLQD